MVAYGSLLAAGQSIDFTVGRYAFFYKGATLIKGKGEDKTQ